MFTTTVISPSIVGAQAFKDGDEVFMSSLAVALYEIIQPGNTCLVDHDGDLAGSLQAMTRVLGHCTPHERLMISQALSAIGSPQSGLLVKGETIVQPGQTMLNAAAQVALRHEVDGLVCDLESKDALAEILDEKIPICCIESWRHGNVAELNRIFAEGPARCTDIGVAKDRIARATRASTKVRVFDKFFARTPSHSVSRWTESLLFVLEAWDDARLDTSVTPTLELYGKLALSPWWLHNREENLAKRKKGHISNYESLRRFLNEIVSPIRKQWPGQVSAFVANHRSVSNGLFHDRWLWAGRGVTLFSGGFAFLPGNRSSKRYLDENFRMKRDPNTKEDLRTIMENSRPLDETALAEYYDEFIGPLT